MTCYAGGGQPAIAWQSLKDDFESPKWRLLEKTLGTRELPAELSAQSKNQQKNGSGRHVDSIVDRAKYSSLNVDFFEPTLPKVVKARAALDIADNVFNNSTASSA